MKFRQIVNARPWIKGSGFSCESTFVNEIVEIHDPEDASPAMWYADYCENQRFEGADDQLIVVKLYAPDAEICEENVLFWFEAWESELIPSVELPINRYSYKELKAAVVKDPNFENVQKLGEWYWEYGQTFWNGEFFEESDGTIIEPIFKVMDGTDPEDELYDIDYYELR